MQQRILLFAGTTEGRIIAEHLAGKPILLDVCVTTAYAHDLLPAAENIRILEQKLDAAQMAKLLQEHSYSLVVDATHPYAQEASSNILSACHAEKVRLLRVLRASETLLDTGEVSILYADGIPEVLDLLADSRGPIFLTTGSKTLPHFMQLPQAADRLFARILPLPEMLQQALSLGLPGNHITCAQGPFDLATNLAAIGSIRNVWSKTHPEDSRDPLTLVTKESGEAGGFAQKLQAAVQTGTNCIVIRRPQENPSTDRSDISPEHLTLSETLALLDTLCGNTVQRQEPVREVFLVGCGMSSSQLTLEADAVLRSCSLLIGAKRMLKLASHYQKESFCSYDALQIRDYLAQHPEHRRVALLFSGDIGLYSGAAKARQCLSSLPGTRVTALSGISSPVQFMNRMGISYEDLHIMSLHGQSPSILSNLRTKGKLLLLLGKADDVSSLCQELVTQGMTDVRVTVGSCLHSPQEQIISGSPADFLESLFDPLSVLYLENPSAAGESLVHGLPDDMFSRAGAPMTKSEIRSIILSKLHLTAGSVFYDIGAGTGSIAVEAARMIPDGNVFAIEKEAAHIPTIQENARRLHADNLQVVCGTAPDALAQLPPPSHALIGGSSGQLREILQELLQKNPSVKIVLSAITFETLACLLKAMEDLSLPEPEIVQIQVSRVKKAGPYHMMQGQNPVFIITFPICTSNE